MAIARLRHIVRKVFSEGGRPYVAGHVENLLLSSVVRVCSWIEGDRSETDPYHVIFRRFVDMVDAAGPARVLEIGGRARSGNLVGSIFRPGTERVGLDILPGDGVDVVGDAHRLGELFEPESFDGVFSISVWEHLAMPWKVALEANRILKVGGLIHVSTHPAWPLHDRPWDFFRFSTDGFRMLFNETTGFEIVEASEGIPARILPLGGSPDLRAVARQPAQMGVSVIARKTGAPHEGLRWDADPQALMARAYPG